MQSLNEVEKRAVGAVRSRVFRLEVFGDTESAEVSLPVADFSKLSSWPFDDSHPRRVSMREMLL